MEDNVLKESIENLQKFIDGRIAAGASVEEINDLYDELACLKTDYLLGELLDP